MARTYFFWEPLSDNVLQERDASGAVTAEYTTEPGVYGNLISQNRGGVESQYHFDAMGSTLALTDDNQTVTDTYAYTAFGGATDHTRTTVNPFRYVASHEYAYDASSSYYSVRRRWYNPELAAWLSSDPALFKRNLEHGYAYVGNNPIVYYDPSGLLKQGPRELGRIIIVIPGVPVRNYSFAGKVWECGGFAFATEWALDASESNGLILQKVCVDHSVTMCDPKKKCKSNLAEFFDQLDIGPVVCGNKKDCGQGQTPRKYCYVELWRVNEGTVFWKTPFSKSKQDDKLANPVDIFAWPGCKAPCTNCSKGSITRTGDAFFVSDSILDSWDKDWRRELPKLFAVGKDGVSDACYLTSACWDSGTQRVYNALLARAGGQKAVTSKVATRTWDCCPPNGCVLGTFTVTVAGTPQGPFLGPFEDAK